MFQEFLPKEIVVGEIYFPPLLIAFGVAYMAANLTMVLIGRMGVLKHLYAPVLVELSLLVIYAIGLSRYVFPG
ncbi:DUF1656 domain-containing protein [Agarivorans litoreus]|uniref:DUF1656 domain-containing protein n=1 Tax=Agarivorans litoreus TaxID=1510455 RepID=UPI001C7CA0DC|nr:DUF1656 domain-containing protein [Agarivorans litoreus]